MYHTHTHDNACHVVGLSTNVGPLVKCVELDFRLTFGQMRKKWFCSLLILLFFFEKIEIACTWFYCFWRCPKIDIIYGCFFLVKNIYGCLPKVSCIFAQIFFVQCSEFFFWSKMLRNFENEGKRPCFGLGLVMEMMQNYSTFCDSVVQRLVTHWFTLFITIFWYNWGYLFFKRGTFHSSRVLIVPL